VIFLFLDVYSVESKRVRVGMMVRKGGTQALTRIEKELARKNLNNKN